MAHLHKVGLMFLISGSDETMNFAANSHLTKPHQNKVSKINKNQKQGVKVLSRTNKVRGKINGFFRGFRAHLFIVIKRGVPLRQAGLALPILKINPYSLLEPF